MARKQFLNVPSKLKDADSILNILGDPGSFQIIQFVLLMLQFVPIAMNDLMPIFYNIRPTGIEIFDSELFNYPNASISDSRPNGTTFLNLSAACDMLRNTGSATLNMSYIYHGRQWSIIGEMDLLCDKTWLADLATTLFFLGQMFGSPLFGWTADRFGRRKTLILCNVAYSVSSTCLVFSKDVISFSVLRFCVGFARQGMHSAAFVLMMEWAQPHRRGTWSAISQFFFAGGVLFLALVGYLLQDWHFIQIVLAVSNFSAVGFYWFAPESLKWLLLHNRGAEAMDVCNRITQFNNITLSKSVLSDIEKILMGKDVRMGNTESESHSFIDCFRTPYIRIFTALCCYIWFATFFTYFAFSFLMAKLAGDIYVNLAIGGCLELIPRILAVISSRKITSRATLLVYFFGAGAFAVICGSIPNGQQMDATSIAKTAMALLGRMAIVGCFPIVSVVTTELFPTAIRNSGFGLCSIAMKIGAMIAPQMALLAFITTYGGTPFYIIGGIATVGCGMTILLPETSDMKLMSTVKEAEEFGSRELLAFYKRKSVSLVTVMKVPKRTMSPSLTRRRKSILEEIEEKF